MYLRCECGVFFFLCSFGMREPWHLEAHEEAKEGEEPFSPDPASSLFFFLSLSAGKRDEGKPTLLCGWRSTCWQGVPKG